MANSMKMRILVCLIFVIADLSVCTVARAQPAPRAVLGVMLRELNPEETQRGLQGAFVQEVLPNGSADKAGIRPDDLVSFIDGEPVYSIQTFRELIGRTRPGTTVRLEVRRGDSLQTIELTLGDHPKTVATPRKKE